MTFAQTGPSASADIGVPGGWTEALVDPVLEQLSIADWATPRDEFDFVFLFPALTYIVNVRQGVYPSEVIKEHGDADDWENLFGTGPYMLTDVVEGSSVTWDRNPDYWGTDEKYPQNRLPYIDQLRVLNMTEPATRLAGLRTGRFDYLGRSGAAQLRTVEQIESLQRTNPELVVWPYIGRSDNGVGMNIQVEGVNYDSSM